MKKLFTKISKHFFQTPITTTFIISAVGSFFLSAIQLIYSVIKNPPNFYFTDILLIGLLCFLFVLPIVLTIENIILFFRKVKEKEQEIAIKIWEVLAIVIGVIYSILSMGLTAVTFEDWHVTLYNNQVHTPIASQWIVSINTVLLVGIIGYAVLRFIPIEKLPPLLAVLCISALYLGMAQLILWSVQIFDIWDPIMLCLCLFSFNCILVAIRTIKNVVQQQVMREMQVPHKIGHVAIMLNNTQNWPWLAFLATIPLLGIIVCALLLFGQEPDSLIKAWTYTADWNMSQKVAPQNIAQDGHYLCTVAAKGHPKIVNPIRTGKRHGRRIVVNRQLCIANAFEQLLEEQVPTFHRFVRGLYDKIGYPIAKHIHSPYSADAIYFIMKPLEWVFLITLYLFDVKPENRIAVQYPHSDLPV